jgi:hypothetical protein
LKCKVYQIRDLWAAGDHIGALRVAARFFDRSTDTMIFKRGMDAYNNSNFYRQLGQEPNHVTAIALERLARKFDLEDGCQAAPCATGSTDR